VTIPSGCFARSQHDAGKVSSVEQLATESVDAGEPASPAGSVGANKATQAREATEIKTLPGVFTGEQERPTHAERVVPFGWAALAGLGWMLAGGLWLSRGAAHVNVSNVTAYGRWAFGHLAYSDLFQLYMTARLGSHAAPYVHLPIQYPVVSGVFMWLAAWAPGPAGYFALSAVGLSLCAMISLWLLSRLVPRSYHWFGFLPLLALYGLLNWDLLGIVFLLAGLEASRRRRLGWAGVFIALGTFAKLFPLVLLGFLLVQLARLRDWRSLGRVLTGFVAVAAVLNLPFALASSAGWSYFFRYNLKRPGSMGLRWALEVLEVHKVPTAIIDATTFGIAALVALACLWWVWRGGPLLSAMALTMLVFFFVNKVYSPQYTLWVLVFLMLASWPSWLYGLLGAMGTLDYFNSFVMLHFSEKLGKVDSWYYHMVFVHGVDLRYGVLALCGIAGGIWLLGADRAGWVRQQA